MCGWCSVHWPTLGWEPGAAPEAVKVSDKRLPSLARPAARTTTTTTHTDGGLLPGPEPRLLVTWSLGWSLGGIMLRLQQGISLRSTVTVCVGRSRPHLPSHSPPHLTHTFSFSKPAGDRGGEGCVVFLCPLHNIKEQHFDVLTMKSLEHSCSKISCNSFYFVCMLPRMSGYRCMNT